MYKVFHKITSVVLVLLLLVSTTSWSVGKHYCMGHLMDIALFSKPDSCGMATASDAMHMESEKSCCNDEIVVFDGLDNLQLSFDDITLESQLLLATFSYSYHDIFALEEKNEIPRDIYPPPLLVKNIQLLDQVFLI